ncbi:MAG: hypothetical protein K5681_07045 [Treponema sp.]|nr:hypothetical protein [Treponema sp.]
MLTRKLKVIFAFLILLCSSASLFAVEEYVSNIYKVIDVIFAKKDGDDLNLVLSENTEDKYYYLIENYTEKKIRRLIVNNDYDFAMEAIVIVIENNLDNEQAVEMYSVISEAYEIQQAHEREEERKHQQELARIEAEKESKRASVDKEYVSAAKSKGGSVYVAGKETKLTSNHWKAALGIADFLYEYEPTKQINTFHYGPSIDFRYEYTMPKLVVGADVFADPHILVFTADDDPKKVEVFCDIELAGKIAMSFAKNMFVRLGFNSSIVGKADYAVDTVNVADTLYTPLIGIKIEKIKVGSSELDFGLDWYAGSLYTNNLTVAMGGMLNLALPYAQMEKVKLTFNLGLRDKIFLKPSGVENRASIILAIGVENVIK